MASPQIGELLRTWRTRRRRSQMDLALDVGVSTRHLSFVETGRSKPSPELVLAVAEHLDVPLRERNTMLLAAGYAPRFSQTPLDDPAMHQVRGSLERMLAAHQPYPGVVIDRQWNVVLTNGAADVLMAVVPPQVLEPRPNVFRVCLHPEGLAPHTLDFDDWAVYLLRQIRRSIVLTGDAGLEEIEQEVLAYATVQHLPRATGIGVADDPPLLVPLRVQLGDDVLSLFTTLTTFGTPRDVTLEELAVELFFPADEQTERLLGGGRATAAVS
jgi:transcriptional regulator with XRE-family HTH domain